MSISVFRFRAKLVWFTPVWRDIEIRSDQTLIHLHNAIQNAFRWYDDHLYSFFLSGEEWDEDTEYTSPDALNGTRDIFGEERRRTGVRLDELGLEKGQTIAYVYDFGDNISLRLKILSIEELGNVRYPRIVALKGYAPEQYNYVMGKYSRRVKNELKKGLQKIVRLEDVKNIDRILAQWSDIEEDSED